MIDECGFMLSPVRRRTLARAGCTPVLTQRARHREKVSVAVALLLSRHRCLSIEALPAYCPELNPVEKVWAYLKGRRLCNFAPHDGAELSAALVRELRELRFRHDLLWGFFEASALPIRRTLLS